MNVRSKVVPRLQHLVATTLRTATTQRTAKRYKSKMTEAGSHPLSGLWKPTHLERLHYGSGSVAKHLISCLPTPTSKAFIITGNSLATRTPLIEQVRDLLGNKHAGTFSKIGQHAPVAQLDEATEAVQNDSSIDTLISVGGGSPIDSAKAISFRNHEKTGKFLYHITIPTTLSAAECTFNAGYTKEDGTKIGVANPKCAPHVIIYDSTFALHSPERLYLSTGIRALDHAVELLYHPYATEMPCRANALIAIGDLFKYLPRYKANPKDEQVITQLQLAAFTSLYYMGLNTAGGLGLSHTLGYALGSPYGIPHGITSCISLAGVVALKLQNPAHAEQLARALPYIGMQKSGHDQTDAMELSKAIDGLVKSLGLESRLKQYDVPEGDAQKVAMTATRGQSPLYEQVLELVQSKY